MSPCSIYTCKTFRAKFTNLATATMGRLLKDAELILKGAQRHELQLSMMVTQAGGLRTAMALASPNSDSAAIIEAIRRRPNSTEAVR